jgi:hypothetical protein
MFSLPFSCYHPEVWPAFSLPFSCIRASKFTHSLVSSPCFLHLSVNHVYFTRFWKLPFWACLFEMIPRSTETQTDFSPPISSVSRLTGFPDVPGMSGTSPSFRRPPSHHVVIESSCHCWPCQRKCQNKCQAPCSRIHVKLSKKFKQNVRIMSENISGYVSQNVSGDMSICQKCQECLKISGKLQNPIVLSSSSWDTPISRSSSSFPPFHARSLPVWKPVRHCAALRIPCRISVTVAEKITHHVQLTPTDGACMIYILYI